MIKEFTKVACGVCDNEVRLGTVVNSTIKSSLICCEGDIKRIERKAGGKVYYIKSFKWALVIVNKEGKEEAICYHNTDYELTEEDTTTVLEHLEGWNNKFNYSEHFVREAKRTGGWTYKKKESKIKVDGLFTTETSPHLWAETINSCVGAEDTDELIHYLGCDFVGFEKGINIYDFVVANKQFNAGCFGRELRDLMVKYGVDVIEFKDNAYIVVEDKNITIGGAVICSDEK